VDIILALINESASKRRELPRIDPIPDPEVQFILLCRLYRLFPCVRRCGDHLDIVPCKLITVLFEIQQLLTAIDSPVSSIEEQHPPLSLQVGWQDDPLSLKRLDYHDGEKVPVFQQ